jgi:hypothetical protein
MMHYSFVPMVNSMDDLDIIFIVGENTHSIHYDSIEHDRYVHMNETKDECVGEYILATMDMMFFVIPNVSNIFCDEMSKLVVQYEID